MAGIQILALVFCVGGVGAVIGAVVSNEWKVTSRASSVITATWVFQGLWMNCAGNALGAFHCRPHLTLFKLEGYIQACRALMIASVCLGGFGSIFALIGMKCSTIGGSDRNKAKITCLAGVVFIISGLSSLSACSLYAYRTTAEYYDPTLVTAKYELGSALFIGWTGAVLCLVGGSIFCCSIAELSKHPRAAYSYNGATSMMSSRSKAHHSAASPKSIQNVPKLFDKNAYV
ncbi:claudin-10 [Ambystoma mexicanum]|uniref:claudin-10 n=1 Tax=Ambystoma mexicanum TaxID=8296 RepID=UPI0037E87CAE